METTLQSSSQGLRTSLIKIEAIELAVLGFVLGCLIGLPAIGKPDTTFLNLFILLIVLEGGLFGSWGIYNLYIRIARATGGTLDVAIWVIAAAVTASYTFWAWTILDINRFLVKKLLYRGEAPVEFAWSARSKQMRKAWEQARKTVS